MNVDQILQSWSPSLESLEQPSSKVRAMGAPPWLLETVCPMATGPGLWAHPAGRCHFWLSSTWSKWPARCCTSTLDLSISKLDSASKLEPAHLIIATGRLSSTDARTWVKLMARWGLSRDWSPGPRAVVGGSVLTCGQEAN